MSFTCHIEQLYGRIIFISLHRPSYSFAFRMHIAMTDIVLYRNKSRVRSPQILFSVKRSLWFYFFLPEHQRGDGVAGYVITEAPASTPGNARVSLGARGPGLRPTRLVGSPPGAELYKGTKTR